MIPLHITNETSPLEAVILGIANSCGPIPSLEEAYDPKSAEHIKAGTYPKEEEMIPEMEAFRGVFEKYGVKVYRPEVIADVNQIFSRDIAFVIEDYIFKSNILPNREPELEAIDFVLQQINPEKVIQPPADVHIEGGDVMLHDEYIFIGTYYGNDYPDYITARTNPEGVDFLTDFFPKKKIVAFDLAKSNTVAEDNALHLDCCFQPVGVNKAIIHRLGFRSEQDYQFLVDLFGSENLFHITKKEMYEMNSNIFSITPNVVVSDKHFTRLNNWLRSNEIQVEEIPYQQIAKQEGLLRCSTLPLRRKK